MTSSVNTPTGFKYVGASINDVSSHFEKNNPISSIFSNPKFGENRTVWPGEILANPKTGMDSWAESSNIFTQGFYSIANSISIVGQSLNPFDSQITTLTGQDRTGMDNSRYGVEVATTLLPVGSTKIAMGPLKQWLRYGPSYSQSLGAQTSLSLRWGASPVNKGKYLNEIPSQTFRDYNQWFRSRKIPGKSWRVQDPGHYHIKR